MKEFKMDDNLCTILVDLLRSYQISENLIEKIKFSDQFIYSMDKPSPVQKSLLSSILFKLLMSGPTPAPREIRIALTISTDTLGWIDDLKLTILPFIKANEESFFNV